MAKDEYTRLSDSDEEIRQLHERYVVKSAFASIPLWKKSAAVLALAACFWFGASGVGAVLKRATVAELLLCGLGIPAYLIIRRIFKIEDDHREMGRVIVEELERRTREGEEAK